VISQAAVTRLASLKRGPINADSLGENLVFRKSADAKKLSNGSFQKKNEHNCAQLGGNSYAGRAV
jgi:hypothetical protein